MTIRIKSEKTIKLAAALKPDILLTDLHMHDECEYPPRIPTHRVIYVVKVKIGGVAVVVAHFVGKQPLDTRAWVLSICKISRSWLQFVLRTSTGSHRLVVTSKLNE